MRFHGFQMLTVRALKRAHTRAAPPAGPCVGSPTRVSRGLHRGVYPPAKRGPGVTFERDVSSVRTLGTNLQTREMLDLIRKALRDVQDAVKPLGKVLLATKRCPNDLTGTTVVVGGDRFRVNEMFAEGGAARVYRCVAVSAGPCGATATDGTCSVAEATQGTCSGSTPKSKQQVPNKSLALKQCLLDPGLSETEAILEGTIHASLSGHENVVTLHAHDVFVPRRRERNAAKEPVRETRAALFVMDLCAESLADFVRQRDGLTETEALLACASAAHAVAHMHARDPPVIHRDVKPENVLRTSSSSDDDDEKNETKDACETHDKSDDDASTSTSQWRLCDFGSAAVGERLFSSSRDRSSAETEFTKNTTPTYRSPEMWDPVRFQASGVGKPCDVWALGCLLFECLQNAPPFGFEPKLVALQGRFAPVTKICISKNTLEIIKDCLRVDPESRPSALDVAARCEECLKRIRNGDGVLSDADDENVKANTLENVHDSNDPGITQDTQGRTVSEVSEVRTLSEKQSESNTIETKHTREAVLDCVEETETAGTGWAAFGEVGDSNLGRVGKTDERAAEETAQTEEETSPPDLTAWNAFDRETEDATPSEDTDKGKGTQQWATF